MSAYSDAVIADGAAHYWRLGETVGTTASDSIGTAHGVISGGVTLGVGSPLGDAAMTFNGATGKIETGAPVVLVPPFTIELWAKTLSGNTTLLSTFSPLVNAEDLLTLALLPDGNPQFRVLYAGADPQAERHTFGQLLIDGLWHHIVWVLSGPTTAQCYVDGVAATTGGVLTDSVTGNTLRGLELGANTTWTGQYFTGSLDDVAVYPLALSPAQIATHYNFARGVVPPRLAYVAEAVPRLSYTVRRQEGSDMAAYLVIGGSHDLYIGEDKTLDFTVADDLTDWAIQFDVRPSVNADTALISKAAVIAGTYSATPAENTQRAVVALTADDLAADVFSPDRIYQHSLKRLNDGADLVLAHGRFLLERATQV